MRCKVSNSFLVSCAATLLGIMIFAFDFWLMGENSHKAEPVSFSLIPLSGGVYGYQETVVSSTPIQNYSMLTVCRSDGNVLTVKGNIRIIFDDKVNPYGIFVDSYTINSDTLTVYDPSGSIEFLGTQKVASRR